MKNFLIIAGEVSGDMHGAALIKEINKIDPEINFFGIGGDKMIGAGLKMNYHIKDMAFLGFVEVLKHLPFISRVKKDLIKTVESKKIDNIILIDYPGFNLNIAKKLKRTGKKIFYYISPQVWAWGNKRIKKIKKLVDKMLVVFPFEKDMYLESEVEAEYVGHPLLEQIEEYSYLKKEELFSKYKLDLNKEILLILPGSRKQEVEKIFPEVIKAAKKLTEEFQLQIIVASGPSFEESYFNDLTQLKDFKVLKNINYDLFKYSKFGIIKSGTSTLEAGLFALPHVVVYKTSRITYLIGKKLIKVNNIALSNIVAGKSVVPELIQDDVNEKRIYSEAKKYLSDDEKIFQMEKELEKIKIKLGESGASKNAAEIILKEVNGY